MLRMQIKLWCSKLPFNNNKLIFSRGFRNSLLSGINLCQDSTYILLASCLLSLIPHPCQLLNIFLSISPHLSLQSIILQFVWEVLRTSKIIYTLPKWLSHWPNFVVSSWSEPMPASIKYTISPPSNIILNSKPFKTKQRTKSSYLAYSTLQQEMPSSNCMGQAYGRKYCESFIERIFED